MKTIRRCRKCRSKKKPNIFTWWANEPNDEGWFGYAIECMNVRCKWRGPLRADIDDCIKAWNNDKECLAACQTEFPRRWQDITEGTFKVRGDYECVKAPATAQV